MVSEDQKQLRGRCCCGQSTCRRLRPPLFTHCCHCTWCQRETGSAFAINALVETENVVLEQGSVAHTRLRSNSGAGQVVVGCLYCQTVLWSHYSSAKEAIAFVRVGTLDRADAITPDTHIFAQAKLPWVQLPTDHDAVDQYYRLAECWPAESTARYEAAIGG